VCGLFYGRECRFTALSLGCGMTMTFKRSSQWSDVVFKNRLIFDILSNLRFGREKMKDDVDVEKFDLGCAIACYYICYVRRPCCENSLCW
jgi:hypothetical protein